MSEMRLTNTLIEWLEAEKWEERPEVNEEDQTSSLSFTHSIGEDFSVTCHYELFEKPSIFKVFMYFQDSKIPVAKIDEVVKWVNMVNIGIPIGHFAVMNDDRVLRYYAGIDVEDAAFETKHISNMAGAGIQGLKYRLPQFMAICFGGKTAEEAFEIEPE